VRAALAAVMLERHEQQTVFDAAFDTFFRDPKLLEQLMYLVLPKIQGRGEKNQPQRPNRLNEALQPPNKNPAPPKPTPDNAAEEQRFDAVLTFSDREQLQRADFETMTVEEFAWARKIAAEIDPPVQRVRRRRLQPASKGRIDLRATMQRMARQPHTLQPAWREPRREWPPVVVLLDISGSMERYARLFLHYVHGLAQRQLKVHAFTFGTRLTNVSRALRHRDPDDALAAADAAVADWKGGTRIAGCLDDFNRHWARRVLGGNAAVLLVTDGLDRDEQGSLTEAAARLNRLAHRVVWLNPLLRFDGFEPRAAGVKALLPHTDEHLPVHNLASLRDLHERLRSRRPANRRAPDRSAGSRRPT
jgi:uncharacterized protein with von Willebrand factor type A (vWA) domain